MFSQPLCLTADTPTATTTRAEGRPLSPHLERHTMPFTQRPRDKQAAHSGKVENDHNKVGDQASTQKNQGERTPASRTDREAHIGSSNQTQSRRGNTGR